MREFGIVLTDEEIKLTDGALRMAGVHIPVRLIDLTWRVYSHLGIMNDQYDLRTASNVQCINRDRFMPPSKRYAHLKGRRYKPSMIHG